MTDNKHPPSNSSVMFRRITITHLLSEILKDHILVASSEPTFLAPESSLDKSLPAVWIKLARQSAGFSFFQKQLADAIAFWDISYATRLKESSKVDMVETIDPLWVHPPQERTLLIFDGIEYVKSGPVYDFLSGLVNHPLENTAVLLLTPIDSLRGVLIAPEDAKELDEVADWIAQGRLRELEAFFVQRGIRYLSPGLTREYLHLLGRIPEEAYQASPVLQIIQAGMYSTTGQVEKAHYVLGRAAATLEAGDLSAEQRWVLGEMYLLQSFLNMNLGITNFLTNLQKADRLLPGGSSLFTRHTGMCLGNNNAMIYPGFEKQDVHRILNIMFEADPYILRLTRGFGYGRPHLASAEVYYYAGQFRKAKSSAQQAICGAGEYEQWDLQCSAHYLLMRIAMAQGDYRQTVKHIYKMKACRLRYDRQQQQLLCLPDLAEAEFYLKIRESRRVAPWLLEDSRSDSDPSPVFSGFTPIIRAICLMESGRLLDALDAVEKAMEQFSRYKYFMLYLQACILKAVLCNSIGELDLAVMHLRLAHELSANNNFMMMFAEYGRHMIALLDRLKESMEPIGIPNGWMDQLRQRTEAYSRNVGHLRSSYLAIVAGDATSGHLTKREREAMELLCEGLSNQQIADRMGIQLTSLKTNLQRIYRKIGAENRADAVRLWLTAKK